MADNPGDLAAIATIAVAIVVPVALAIFIGVLATRCAVDDGCLGMQDDFRQAIARITRPQEDHAVALCDTPIEGQIVGVSKTNFTQSMNVVLLMNDRPGAIANDKMVGFGPPTRVVAISHVGEVGIGQAITAPIGDRKVIQ